MSRVKPPDNLEGLSFREVRALFDGWAQQSTRQERKPRDDRGDPEGESAGEGAPFQEGPAVPGAPKDNTPRSGAVLSAKAAGTVPGPVKSTAVLPLPLRRENLMQSVVMAEVLGRPLALRRRGR